MKTSILVSLAGSVLLIACSGSTVEDSAGNALIDWFPAKGVYAPAYDAESFDEHTLLPLVFVVGSSHWDEVDQVAVLLNGSRLEGAQFKYGLGLITLPKRNMRQGTNELEIRVGSESEKSEFSYSGCTSDCPAPILVGPKETSQFQITTLDGMGLGSPADDRLIRMDGREYKLNQFSRILPYVVPMIVGKSKISLSVNGKESNILEVDVRPGEPSLTASVMGYSAIGLSAATPYFDSEDPFFASDFEHHIPNQLAQDVNADLTEVYYSGFTDGTFASATEDEQVAAWEQYLPLLGQVVDHSHLLEAIYEYDEVRSSLKFSQTRSSGIRDFTKIDDCGERAIYKERALKAMDLISSVSGYVAIGALVFPVVGEEVTLGAEVVSLTTGIAAASGNFASRRVKELRIDAPSSIARDSMSKISGELESEVCMVHNAGDLLTFAGGKVFGSTAGKTLEKEMSKTFAAVAGKVVDALAKKSTEKLDRSVLCGLPMIEPVSPKIFDFEAESLEVFSGFDPSEGCKDDVRWKDDTVCNFETEWTAGSTINLYQSGRLVVNEIMPKPEKPNLSLNCEAEFIWDPAWFQSENCPTLCDDSQDQNGCGYWSLCVYTCPANLKCHI